MAQPPKTERLFIDGPVARQQDKAGKMQIAADMLKLMQPSTGTSNEH